MRIVFLVVYTLYLLLRSKKSFQMLQQNFYNNSNRYIKWIFKNHDKTIITLDLLFIIGLLLGEMVGCLEIIETIFYGLLILYTILTTKKEKITFKITSRVKRMFVTFSILYFLVLYVGNLLSFDWYVFLLGLFVSLNYFVIYLVNILNKPIEKIVYLYYYRQAKNKIQDMNRLKVIGITGSYGKTSSKNILADILKVHFDTFATPKNYNTPYGLMLTINQYLDKFTEYFIAEMGACEVGQIQELCDFVHPTYGILTKIGVAHLDSFKTEENIQKTKFELIESLPSEGIGILNMDDPKQVSYQLKNDCKIRWISTQNKKADLYAFNICGTSQGMTFDVCFRKTKEVCHLETKLLGSANVYNILAAVMLAFELGMPKEEIQIGVKGIQPIEHRLEMKKLGSITIIDDAYNSNPVGANMAVETLALMPGKKVIVTPGMIELKDQEYHYNFEFGKQIAKVCDLVILVGKSQTKPIYDGLLDAKYPKDQIQVYDNVFDAFTIVRKMSKGTYVLLENDLPDIFNE